MFAHEMFHRIQPALHLATPDTLTLHLRSTKCPPAQQSSSGVALVGNSQIPSTRFSVCKSFQSTSSLVAGLRFGLPMRAN
jgi:hypothetical protein